jgi:hypothetical protein
MSSRGRTLAYLLTSTPALDPHQLWVGRKDRARIQVVPLVCNGSGLWYRGCGNPTCCSNINPEKILRTFALFTQERKNI